MLNVFAYILVIGAVGQQWFYVRFFPSVPSWIISGFLFLPWIYAHIITFCNRALFGPKLFRLSLLAIMACYTSFTVGAEVIQFYFKFPADGHFTVTAARTLMYFGFVSFVPFFYVYTLLGKHLEEQDV